MKKIDIEKHMLNYTDKFKNLFNQSQYEVLIKVQ